MFLGAGPPPPSARSAGRGQSPPMHEPEELFKPPVPAIGDSPLRKLNLTSNSSDNGKASGRASSQVGPEETETDEELEMFRRRSVALRDSCVHEIIKEGNMKPRLSDAAIDEASMAIVRAEKRGQGWDSEIAARIKKRMDKRFASTSGGRWHCIVGPDFGSYVSHEKGHMIYLYLPRYLAPTEKIEYERSQRKKAEAEELQPNTPRLPPMIHGEEAPSTLDLTRTGPLLGEGNMAQRMVGILLWRT